MQALPTPYHLARTIDLQTNQALLVKLNLWGLVSFAPIGYLFVRIGMASHPEIHSLYELVATDMSLLAQLFTLILSLVAVTILHEMIHGALFWLFTRQRPFFGFKGAYAFAAAPDWYLPRKSYFWVGVAPLAIISIVGLCCLPCIPVSLLLPWLFGLLANASGSIGDVYVLAVLMLQPATALIQDRGDVISIFSDAAA